VAHCGSNWTQPFWVRTTRFVAPELLASLRAAPVWALFWSSALAVDVESLAGVRPTSSCSAPFVPQPADAMSRVAATAHKVAMQARERHPALRPFTSGLNSIDDLTEMDSQRNFPGILSGAGIIYDGSLLLAIGGAMGDTRPAGGPS